MELAVVSVFIDYDCSLVNLFSEHVKLLMNFCDTCGCDTQLYIIEMWYIGDFRYFVV